MQKEKTLRTARNVESILAGALKLPLSDRIEICKQLHLSIDAEVKELQLKASEASNLVSQLNGK